MQNTSGIQLPALLKLIPVILEFKKLQQEGLQNDVRDVAERVGGTFGIEDVDAFLEEQIKRAVRDGAGIMFDDRAVRIKEELANLQEFVGKCALDGLSAVQKGIAALDLPVFGGE